MAVNWLSTHSTDNKDAQEDKNSSMLTHTRAPNPQQNQNAAIDLKAKASFELGDYVIPQWKGESLLTKNGLKLKNIVKSLYGDANELVKTFPSRNKSLKLTIYNEFIAYIECEGLSVSGVTDYNLFWEQYLNEYSPNKEIIQKFLNLYCLRAVNIYLLKVRFLTLLMKSYKRNLTTIELLNPDSTLRKIFKTASSTELKCESLRTNEFSWFRPSQELADTVGQLSTLLQDLEAVEFMKVCNYETPIDLGLRKCEREGLAQEASETEENFSHALSNRNFGLFINDLLIYIPEWIESHNGYFNFDQGPKCLNTLFTGDYLSSLSLSHWLAQESSVNKRWQEVISPDFKGNDFKAGSYLKVCQEIQFLSFLVKMAERQNHNPVSLICSIFKQKNAKARTNASGQMSIFDGEQAEESIYDRTVLNLVNLPKKNPHHYLLTQIQNQGERMANNGYLYVFTNQKLFVPSHSEKIEALLKRFKLHARVNFENLQGKGEIAKYLYVFNKRIISNKLDLYGSSAPKLQKESCLSLNFNGKLSHFSKFELLRNEFHSFIADKETINSTVYQKEFDTGLSFEFHQDAILNGKLLSNNGDTNNITHPSYFKNLTRTCIPFDQFFMVENLSNQDDNYTSDLLGLTFKAEERYPYLLIVNFTNEHEINVELTTSDLLKAKVEEYGHAYFQYFGLVPKVANLNINLFREFFATNVGKQIIQLTFNGGLKKTKSKLKAMLVPKFIMETDFIPEHLVDSLGIFNIGKEEFKFRHPQHIVAELDSAESLITRLKGTYPWHLSCLVSHFKYTVEEALSEFKSPSSELKVDYSNPVVMGELIALPKQAIYPANDDIYVDAKIKDRNDIHLPLSFTQLEKQETGYSLSLYSNEKEVISLHGDYELLHFINFILSNSPGTPISKILQGLEVPRSEDIKAVLTNHTEVESSLKECSSKSHQILNNIIVGQIFNS